MKYMLQIMIPIPNRETIDTLCLGALDPYPNCIALKHVGKGTAGESPSHEERDTGSKLALCLCRYPGIQMHVYVRIYI